MGQTGSCLLDLGRPEQAAEAFADARNAFSPDEIRTRAQFLSRAATAQMRAGDVDAGSATGHEVLTLVDGVRSARLDDNLAAKPAATPRRHPPWNSSTAVGPSWKNVPHDPGPLGY